MPAVADIDFNPPLFEQLRLNKDYADDDLFI